MLFSRPLDASANEMLDHSNGYLSYQLGNFIKHLMAGEIKPYAYTFALHFVFIFCSSPQRVFMSQLAFHFFSLHLLSVCITWSLPSPTHGLMLLNSSFWTKPNFASDMKHVSPLMLLFNYKNPNRSFTFPFPFLSLLLLF